MRAKTIFEKFTEKSDPVADLGIGGVKFESIRSEILDEAKETWKKIVTDTLAGSTLKGKVRRIEGALRNNYLTKTIYINKVRFDKMDPTVYKDRDLFYQRYKQQGIIYDIIVEDTNHMLYALSLENKYLVSHES